MVQPDEAADSWDPAVGESWLAAPVAGTGLAVYGNGAWGPPEVVWPRVLRWLRTDLAAGAGVERVERAARAGYVTPAAVGLETDRRGSRRVKVYVRLAARVPLRLLDLPPLQRPEVAEFLRTVLTGAPLPGTGLVLAIGLGPDGGDVQEVKVDVCACDRCLPALAGPWTVTLGRLSERLGCPFGWDSALVAGVRPAFVGMGIGTVGAPRVNLYLQAA
ncbi:MAG: hypothetical protein JWP95_1080, partial [Actinotalea sp.]|nr:hypothetical protein [Actinotalea sp.]